MYALAKAQPDMPITLGVIHPYKAGHSSKHWHNKLKEKDGCNLRIECHT